MLRLQWILFQDHIVSAARDARKNLNTVQYSTPLCLIAIPGCIPAYLKILDKPKLLPVDPFEKSIAGKITQGIVDIESYSPEIKKYFKLM